MIVLTSNGLSSGRLLQEAKRYIRPGKAALVVTADPVYKEKNYHVPRLSRELAALGLSVEPFDFDTRMPCELRAYGVVEMIGGNPYYLLHSIMTHGFAEVLAELSQDRCLIGCSAGSVVMTPTLKLIDQYSPEMNTVGLKDLTALGLTSVQILPHYSKFLARYERFEGRCAQYERENRCSVIRLNDGEAVLIDQERLMVTGGA